MMRDYNYRVKWSPEDDTFVARVLEFQSLSAHGETRDAAEKALREMVALAVEDLKKRNEPVPKPRRKRLIKKHITVR